PPAPRTDRPVGRPAWVFLSLPRHPASPYLRPVLAPFRRPLRLLRPYRWTMVAGALCPPTTAALGILLTDRIAAVLGALQEGGDGCDLDGACLVLLAIGLGIAVLRFLARNLLIQVSRRVERDLKDSLLAHLQRLPIAFFDRAGTGDLVSRMTQDVEVVRFMLGPAVLYGTSALVVVPGVLTVMATLSPLLTGAITVAFALLLLSSRRLMPRLQDASQRVQQAIGALSDRALEDFLGIRVLLAFGRARAEERRMAGMAERYLTANIDLTRLRALYNLMLHVSSDF